MLLFGLSALAIGQGDAIRWYPLFAMLIALFVTLYLFGGNDAARLGSAVFLGLAASTNFLAILVAAPFALYRYGLQRQFRMPFDIAFGLAVLVFAIPGIVSAYAIFAGPLGGPMLAAYGGGIMRIVASDLLGFFGGDALGIRQAWVLVPALAISALATIAAIDRREPASPVHLLLLLLAATVLMAPASFAQPRSFLYLAPVMAAVVTLFLDRQARQRAAATVLMVSLLLAASVGSIANINGGSHPFKRNAAIPYQSVVDFIDSNGSGSDLVISTDPVIPWVLAHRANHGELCASYFVSAPGCFAADKRYDSVFVISGYSDKSGRPAAMRRFTTAVAQATAGRRKLATLHAGVDEDADLKTRLTGVALDKYILTVDLYR